jgi:putative ABC transport system permease protein
MIAAGLLALLSHWRRHPLQLVTLVAGLALATALWSGVQAINAEARASYGQAADTLGEGRLSRLLPPQGATIPESTFVALRRAGWLVSPVVQGRLGSGPDGVRLLGLDPFTAPQGLQPIDPAQGTDTEAFLSPQGALVGRPETLADLPETGATLLPSEDAAPGTVLTDIRTAQRLLGRDGFDALLLAPDQPLRQTPLDEVAPDLRLQAPDAATDPAALTDSFHLNLTAFGPPASRWASSSSTAPWASPSSSAAHRSARCAPWGCRSGTLILLMALELALLALLAGRLGPRLGLPHRRRAPAPTWPAPCAAFTAPRSRARSPSAPSGRSPAWPSRSRAPPSPRPRASAASPRCPSSPAAPAARAPAGPPPAPAARGSRGGPPPRGLWASASRAAASSAASPRWAA